jgi:putative transport protein
LQFEVGFSAGLLAGGLTSTPTLVGAQDAVNSGLAHIPANMTAEEVLSNISVGYALTYLVGTIMVIFVISYAPKFMQLNLEAMALTFAQDKGMLPKKRSTVTTADTLPLIRAYRVTAEGAGKTLAHRAAELNIPAIALRVKRANQLLEAKQDLVLEKDDIVSLIASLNVHQWARDNLGYSRST